MELVIMRHLVERHQFGFLAQAMGQLALFLLTEITAWYFRLDF